MNRIVNWFKDFIYNITDYGIILGVIAVVAAVLVWRFDILFSTNIQKDPIVAESNAPITSTNIDNNKNNDDKEPSETTNPGEEEPVENNPTEQPEAPVEVAQENPGKEINITIPSGSFPSKIADILANAGLIDDKTAFLDRSVALSLDTKLKSGDYTIAQGESIDNILEILSK